LNKVWLELDLGVITTLGGFEVYWSVIRGGVWTPTGATKSLIIPGLEGSKLEV
jgi:hypothetical protein